MRVIVNIGRISLRGADPRVKRFSADFTAALTQMLAKPGTGSRLFGLRDSHHLSANLAPPVQPGAIRSVGAQAADAVVGELLK